VERDGGNLEQQSGHRGQQGNDRDRIVRVFGKKLRQVPADLAQVRAAGETVQ